MVRGLSLQVIEGFADPEVMRVSFLGITLRSVSEIGFLIFRFYTLLDRIVGSTAGKIKVGA